MRSWEYGRVRLAKTAINFIVNGEDVPIGTEIDDTTLGDLRDIALWRSRNRGRDSDDWELRDCSGHLLNPFERASTFDSRNIFLTLAVGFGGCLRSA
jgi:hypothetical protein